MTKIDHNIVSSIDAEISRLQEARALLTGTVNSPGKRAATKKKPHRRKLSPAARKRMSEAQRKRWAENKAAK